MVQEFPLLDLLSSDTDFLVCFNWSVGFICLQVVLKLMLKLDQSHCKWSDCLAELEESGPVKCLRLSILVKVSVICDHERLGLPIRDETFWLN